VIAFGTDGEIRAAYPFSAAPTPVQVTWAGGPVTYAMCAIDALGISAMLSRPVTITAAEPGTGRIITIHADRDRAPRAPECSVVFAGATGDTCCPSADRTCGYISFFTSAQAARTWADQHPAITGAVLTQAPALSQGIAEFGPSCEPGTAPASPPAGGLGGRSPAPRTCRTTAATCAAPGRRRWQGTS
jgi:alkylmercury lyase-like protein